MRILIVSQYYWPENFRINDLTSGLLEHGHSVTVLTGVPNYPKGKIFPEYKKNPCTYLNYKGAQIIRVPIVPRGSSSLQLLANYLSFVLSASTIGLFKLRYSRFDAVFVAQLSPVTICLPAVLYRHLYRVPVVSWVLDIWPDTLKAVGIVKSKRTLDLIGTLVSFIYNSTDLILAQSRSFIPLIKKYCKHPNIRYFPGWAESVFYDVYPFHTVSTNNQSSFNIVFAGNIGEAQDFPAVLDAAEELKSFPHIRWTIVGDGRMYNYVRHQIDMRELNSSVFLAGRHPLESMPYFFQRADALLVSLKDDPIFSYTIPGKLQAYLQAGRPVLAMLDGEGAELIRNNACGLTCPAGDSRALASLVLKLSQSSSEELAQMGTRAYKLAKTEFDRDRLIKQLDVWLHAVTDSQPPSPASN